MYIQWATCSSTYTPPTYALQDFLKKLARGGSREAAAAASALAAKAAAVKAARLASAVKVSASVAATAEQQEAPLDTSPASDVGGHAHASDQIGNKMDRSHSTGSAGPGAGAPAAEEAAAAGVAASEGEPSWPEKVKVIPSAKAGEVGGKGQADVFGDLEGGAAPRQQVGDIEEAGCSVPSSPQATGPLATLLPQHLQASIEQHKQQAKQQQQQRQKKHGRLPLAVAYDGGRVEDLMKVDSAPGDSGQQHLHPHPQQPLDYHHYHQQQQQQQHQQQQIVTGGRSGRGSSEASRTEWLPAHLDLEWMREATDEEASDYLLSVEGLGSKSAG